VYLSGYRRDLLSGRDSAILFLTLLLGLLVNAVVLPLDQIHLRFFLPAVQFSANLKMNVSGVRNLRRVSECVTTGPSRKKTI
jgi:hypothetical protein